MPCDSVQTCKLDIKVADRATFKKALETLGYTVTERGKRLQFIGGRDEHRITTMCEFNGEQLILPRGKEYIADTIKQAYSQQIVAQIARFNWNVVPQGQNKYMVSRKY